MKKIGLIGVGFVLAVAIFGVAGFAYAQSVLPESPQAQIPLQPHTTESPEFPYERAGWSRGNNGGMVGIATGGMMAFDLDVGEPGPLHDYLWPAVAEAFGLTEAQIEAFEIVRETTKNIREDLTVEEIRNTMKQAMTVAIESALVDGAISEQQADVWLERLENMEDMPFGRRGKTGDFRQGFSRGVKFGRQTLIYHEYLDAAIADLLEVSIDDLREMKTEQGFTLKAYADEQGLSRDELNALRLEILTDAVNQALEDGAITREQGIWVLEHLENIEGRGDWFDQP